MTEIESVPPTWKVEVLPLNYIRTNNSGYTPTVSVRYIDALTYYVSMLRFYTTQYRGPRIITTHENSSSAILPFAFLHSRRESFIKDMNSLTTSYTPRRGIFHLEHSSHPCLILRTKAGKTNSSFLRLCDHKTLEKHIIANFRYVSGTHLISLR